MKCGELREILFFFSLVLPAPFFLILFQIFKRFENYQQPTGLNDIFFISCFFMHSTDQSMNFFFLLLTFFLSLKSFNFYWLEGQTIDSNMTTVQYTFMTSIDDIDTKNQDQVRS